MKTIRRPNYIEREIMLKRVAELSKTNLPITKQCEQWVKETGMSNRTFFRFRHKLGFKWGGYYTPQIEKNIYDQFDDPDRYIKVSDITPCYFCGRLSHDTHHIDKNKQNNNTDNLLDLCSRCHRRLHVIYDKILP